MSRRQFLARSAAACLLILSTTVAQAASNDEIGTIEALPGECAIDAERVGMEDCWRNAKQYEVPNEYQPDPGRAPPVRTRFKVAQDGDSLYILVDCEDPSPADLRYVITRRDKVGLDQDSVTILLDPIGNRTFAQLFRVNPAGSISDGTFNEASGETSFSQDFEFSVHTRIHDHGWAALFKLPFRSIRHAGAGSAKPWTLLVVRSYPRDKAFMFASSPISVYSDCYLCKNPALTNVVIPERVQVVEAVPYTIARKRSETIQGQRSKSDFQVTGGVDVKARLGAATYLDATINPDFSQVEIDTPQLTANARFGIFYPEKRPFFLEGADLFDTPVPVIYTRSIADPGVGARVTRRTESSDVLTVIAHDRGGAAILYPGTWSSIAIERNTPADIGLIRGRYRVGDSATVGYAVSERSSDDGERNTVLSVDSSWQINDANRVRFQAAASSTKNDQRAMVEGQPWSGYRDDSAFFADHSFYGESVDSLFTIARVGKDFRSDNGFISQAGYMRVREDFTYRRTLQDAWFQRMHPYVSVEEVRSLTGELVSETLHPALLLLGPYNLGLLFEGHLDRATVDEGSPIRETRQLLVSVKANPNKVWTLVQLDAEFGRRLDYDADIVGPGLRIFAQSRIRIGQRTEVDAQYSLERIDHPSLNGGLTDQAAQLLVTYSLSPSSWLRLIVQGTRTDRGASPGIEASTLLRHVYSLVALTHPWRELEVSAGVTLDRQADSGSTSRQTEVFIKASWPLRLL